MHPNEAHTKKTGAPKIAVWTNFGRHPDLPTRSVGGHRGRKPFPSSLRVRGAGTIAAASDDQRRWSRSGAKSAFSAISRQSAAPLLPIGVDLGIRIRPSDGGPRVRIRLSPASAFEGRETRVSARVCAAGG